MLEGGALGLAGGWSLQALRPWTSICVCAHACASALVGCLKKKKCVGKEARCTSHQSLVSGHACDLLSAQPTYVESSSCSLRELKRLRVWMVWRGFGLMRGSFGFITAWAWWGGDLILDLRQVEAASIPCSR